MAPILAVSINVTHRNYMPRPTHVQISLDIMRSGTHNVFMNRAEQTAADVAGNHARNRFAEEIANSPTFTVAMNICQNCGQSCDRLTPVPKFDYLGCDSCMEEALAVLAAEGVPSPFVTARKPPATARTQGELFPEVA